ncbi:uncharacterized protein LOC127714241 [Mytilus californianus]|uniref:uncharacterized protein LOC127714241 n=1 Tax=Mytilus californianus TaxID=6549 RepID=UPI002245F38B|nr:uncharacterized protein LOC127714241 [Mytilus californianus]
MSESATENVSTELYQYLCQNIVGTEDHVKTIRMMNTVRDNLQSDKTVTIITSGSFGEGLQMRGSDYDVMTVLKKMEVCEDTPIYFNTDKVYFKMEMVDTQTGFTKLRLVHCKRQHIFEDCEVIGSDFYFSNSSFKQHFMTKAVSTVHGPCVSDKDKTHDFAHCLHSKLWIAPAMQWVTRSNNSWPRYDIKQTIVKHGVLFVPIGVKGSTKEELEWRISFSVGEKLLIHTFTHTQLQCYALLKILLKDVITLDRECKELLCSYFMKTVLFWICEELPSSIWKPENLISCFMRCFRRLIYCVEYTICPHYFIPENNLFEKKVQGHARKTLLNKLYVLNSYGWQCILLSDQISNFHQLVFDIKQESSFVYAKRVEKLVNSFMSSADDFSVTYDFLLEKVLYKVLSSKSSKLKYLYIYYMSKFCCKSEQLLPFEDVPGNKSAYKQYRTCISTVLLNTRHDAVSGWLMLASFFYRRKQYNTALYIVQYTLLKCSPEKLYMFMKFSDIHYELFNSRVIRKMITVQLWRFFRLDEISFKGTRLVPDELHFHINGLPPVVYAHFICFLCHFHLKNRRQTWNSLRDLQLTIEENFFIAIQAYKALSYNILGICFQLLGDIESARKAFLHSIELFSDELNDAYNLLFLIS